eukprot:CAMPEP_0206456314 /NCGR_PEP_ID=MMETSP0324_2-20121206/22289_1 /ASSEMBLY_ACC=CAM_ASM_000836 /TAXON_ID=2866 /ORGANISM="Crypthecodinium cohnii, Strain Seligo" /LENGTH=1107 /DNA_ID=CAMNT_0053927215 /DNA_START=102 /DNA_END=3421 /DNA_ORIENTATION=+
MTTESFRKEVAAKLSGLQTAEDEGASVAFPTTLTSSDRKYVHKIAESFKLHTMSSGVGDARFITVYKNVPEGQEAKRNPQDRAFVPDLSLQATAATQLMQAAAAAPAGTGKTVLADVQILAKNRKGLAAHQTKKVQKKKVKKAPEPPQLVIGGECEGYWPDDDTWLSATLLEEYDDGSFRIAWSEDASESDVPAEYVRVVGGDEAVAMDAEEEEEYEYVEDNGIEPVLMDVDVMEAAIAERRENPRYARIGEKREQLPGFKERAKVVEAIRDNQICLLVGETGCGKSTQVPQHILDSCPEAKVLVMQPRKLAATTLAQRIAEERCQKLGEDVGYQVPFGGKAQNARLVFATLGVFRKRMLHDTELDGITHVVFDEVHERDKLADFNMIFVRDLAKRRKDLRVVLMSATLQMETFERYFEGATKIEVPGRVYPVSELYMDEVAATLWKQPMFRRWLGPGILCGGIDIPAGAEGAWNEKEWKTVVFQNTRAEDKDHLWGLSDKGLEEQMLAPMSKARLLDGLRKHDVLQQSSLAFDYPIIEALILHIDRMHKEQLKNKKPEEPEKPPGTILVFLPGWGDIDQLLRRLTANFDKERFKVLPLHSQVTAEQQEEIFQKSQVGIRKIVLTTNIAEASITVEGTEFVIDCGRAKEVSYDPYLKVGTLTTSWISQASAKQRAGRAGRTQGGLCFHLFCRERLYKMDEYLAPELLRSPLEDSALTAKLMLLQMGSKEKVRCFLAKAPDPPEQIAIDNSIALLQELGAFSEGEELTALGEHLTTSPLPPRLAKTVLWAILLGVLDDALYVVSAAGGFVRDPFRTGGMDREEILKLKKQLSGGENSDHICLMKAVQGFMDAANQQAFCDKYKLAMPAMRQITEQQNRIFTELQENKTESFANRNRGNQQLLVAVLNAGIFPNVARRRGAADFYEAQGGKVEARVHGSSAYVPQGKDEWVFFQELSQMESSYKLKLVSPVEPLPMLLLGGEGQALVDNGKGGKGGKGKGKDGTTISLLDGWVKFRTDDATANAICKLRGALHDCFQAFCKDAGSLPPPKNLALFDKAALILSGKTAAEFGGMKRAASWNASGAPPAQRPKYGGGGKGGGQHWGGGGGG